MDNSIIEKIQKLLARGDADRNDNENEREIAIRQANSLLVKYGLSMADVTDTLERKETLGKLGRSQVELTSRYVWESGIFAEIARLNGCKIVRIPARRGHQQKVWVIGRQLHCTTTRYIAQYVVESVRSEAKKGKYSIVAFGLGAWHGVARQVTKILDAQKAGNINGEQVSESTALAVVDQHKQSLIESNRALGEFFPNAQSDNYSYSGDGYGMSAGRSFGENVNLNQQVAGSKQVAIGYNG